MKAYMPLLIRTRACTSSFLVFDAIVRYRSVEFDIAEGYMKHIDLMALLG